MRRHARDHAFDEIAVRIEERHALATGDVLADQLFKERGLAGTGRADDVQVRPPVRAPDAEAPPVLTEVRLAEDGDVAVGVDHPSSSSLATTLHRLAALPPAASLPSFAPPAAAVR